MRILAFATFSSLAAAAFAAPPPEFAQRAEAARTSWGTPATEEVPRA